MFPREHANASSLQNEPSNQASLLPSGVRLLHGDLVGQQYSV